MKFQLKDLQTISRRDLENEKVLHLDKEIARDYRDDITLELILPNNDVIQISKSYLKSKFRNRNNNLIIIVNHDLLIEIKTTEFEEIIEDFEQ